MKNKKLLTFCSVLCLASALFLMLGIPKSIWRSVGSIKQQDLQIGGTFKIAIGETTPVNYEALNRQHILFSLIDQETGVDLGGEIECYNEVKKKKWKKKTLVSGPDGASYLRYTTKSQKLLVSAQGEVFLAPRGKDLFKGSNFCADFGTDFFLTLSAGAQLKEALEFPELPVILNWTETKTETQKFILNVTPLKSGNFELKVGKLKKNIRKGAKHAAIWSRIITINVPGTKNSAQADVDAVAKPGDPNPDHKEQPADTSTPALTPVATPTAPPVTPVPTETPATPVATPTAPPVTPVPTETPATPVATPTAPPVTPVPTETPATPVATPTAPPVTPVPTETPATPVATPTAPPVTPVPTETPATPVATPTAPPVTPVPTETPATPVATPTAPPVTPVPTETPATPVATPTAPPVTPVPTETPATPVATPTAPPVTPVPTETPATPVATPTAPPVTPVPTETPATPVATPLSCDSSLADACEKSGNTWSTESCICLCPKPAGNGSAMEWNGTNCECASGLIGGTLSDCCQVGTQCNCPSGQIVNVKGDCEIVVVPSPTPTPVSTTCINYGNPIKPGSLGLGQWCGINCACASGYCNAGNTGCTTGELGSHCNYARECQSDICVSYRCAAERAKTGTLCGPVGNGSSCKSGICLGTGYCG